jgi:hypothetical protein
MNLSSTNHESRGMNFGRILGLYMYVVLSLDVSIVRLHVANDSPPDFDSPPPA